MQLLVFHYTLAFLLATVLSAALCLSASIVSHKRTFLFAAGGFFFYFLDMAWIFQDSYVTGIIAPDLIEIYIASRFAWTLVSGTGLLWCFWLLLCEYLEEESALIRTAPTLIFVLSSSAILVFFPEGDAKYFVFYTLRMVAVAAMLVFVAFKFFTAKTNVEILRFKHHRLLYVAIWLGCFAVIAEDVACFFILSSDAITDLAALSIPDRNYSENALMVVLMVSGCINAARTLRLRSTQAPSIELANKREELRIEENLIRFGDRYKLTAREREILHLILRGKDNQNIASEKQLALSTVKVHVHNILKKTNVENRQKLIEKFWRF